MGTRGAIGFRVNSQDKVTYNHSDSYPDWLGKHVIEYIQNNTLDTLKLTAESIVLVKEDSIPTEQQLEECKKWNNFNVSTGAQEEWYCVLRSSQGDLFSYNNGLKYMLDSNEFLFDSLFCEYAYIINVDKNILEFYSGFNKLPSKNKGRYANTLKGHNRYYGVALLMKIPLSEIQSATPEQVDEIINTMNKKAERRYQYQERRLKKMEAA